MTTSLTRVACAIGCLVPLAACDTPTLPAGATLNLSFEAAVLHPAAAPSMPPDDKTACVDDGGAVVDVRAWTPDGKPAHKAQVMMWLDPALGGQLVALGTTCVGDSDDACLALDEGGEGHACLLPGESFGTITVFAHSGVVQQSKSIDVRAHVLAAGSTLTVGAVPVDLTTVTPDGASVCGMPAAAGCTPGRKRRALVTVSAASPDGMPPPRDGTAVSLEVTQGWIADGDCTTAAPQLPNVNVTLTNGIADATWCFADFAATGTVRAQSGSIDGTATASVRAIPDAVLLTTSAGAVAAGADVALIATVIGCDGSGVAGVPIVFATTSGTATITPPAPVVSDENGVATATATLAATATFSAAIAAAPSVNCTADVEVEVTP